MRCLPRLHSTVNSRMRRERVIELCEERSGRACKHVACAKHVHCSVHKTMYIVTVPVHLWGKLSDTLSRPNTCVYTYLKAEYDQDYKVRAPNFGRVLL